MSLNHTHPCMDFHQLWVQLSLSMNYNHCKIVAVLIEPLLLLLTAPMHPGMTIHPGMSIYPGVAIYPGMAIHLDVATHPGMTIYPL